MILTTNVTEWFLNKILYNIGQIWYLTGKVQPWTSFRHNSYNLEPLEIVFSAASEGQWEVITGHFFSVSLATYMDIYQEKYLI